MVDIGEIVRKLRKGLYWLGGDYTCKKYMKVFRGANEQKIEIYFPFDDFVSGGEEPKLMATIELRGTNGRTKREIKFHHVQHTRFRRGFSDDEPAKVYLKPLVDIILEYNLKTNVRGGVIDSESNHRFFKSKN